MSGFLETVSQAIDGKPLTVSTTPAPVAVTPTPTGGFSDFLPHGKYFPYVVAGGALLTVSALILLSKKRGRRR